MPVSRSPATGFYFGIPHEPLSLGVRRRSVDEVLLSMLVSLTTEEISVSDSILLWFDLFLTIEVEVYLLRWASSNTKL